MTGKDVDEYFSKQKFFREYLKTVPPDEVADVQKTQAVLKVFVDENQQLFGVLPCTMMNLNFVMKCFYKSANELDQKEESKC